MRKLLVVLLVAVIVGIWSKGFVGSGECDRFLDRHFTAATKAPVEYYAGVLLSLAYHKRAAVYRFNRVMERYPKSEYAPDAWVEMIETFEDLGDRDAVVRECRKFLAACPDHVKARLIRKKLDVIEYGY
jgi:hypothetical protein